MKHFTYITYTTISEASGIDRMRLEAQGCCYYCLRFVARDSANHMPNCPDSKRQIAKKLAKIQQVEEEK